MSFINTRRAAAALSAALLGACGDATAPTIDQIDAAGAVTASAPVIAVMEQPALASFTSITDVPGVPTSASAAAVAAVSRLTKAAAERQWDGTGALLARSASRAADVIPPDARGKTYVYNETLQAYEAAATAEAGTPATGIRVILYAWDALSGVPSLPLTRVGHVDFTDQSTPGQDRLAVALTRASDGLVLMSYAITHTLPGSTESFSIVGEATNGALEVDFSLTGTAGPNTANVTFELEAPAIGFEVYVGATVDGLAEQVSVETRLGYNGHTLSFELTAQANGAQGVIKFDGYRYATLTMTVVETPGSISQTVTFQKANGRPLTAEELERIETVFERALDFDRFWTALLWPVGALAESTAM